MEGHGISMEIVVTFFPGEDLLSTYYVVEDMIQDRIITFDGL